MFLYVENQDIQMFFSAIDYFSQHIDRNMLEKLMKNDILAAGTVTKRYIPAEADIPAILAGPRGSHHPSVRGDEKINCFNWMDNKSVLFMSSAHAVDPSD